MRTALVEKVDGKLIVTVPHDQQDELNLREGEAVELKRAEGLLIQTRPRYSLEQLLAEHKEIVDQLEVDRAWLDAPRVGRELI